MFQLQISDNDVTSGSIAVSWCLDHEVLKKLADMNIVDPQVVICVAPSDKYYPTKEYRKVVPLKDLMTYVEFRTSGKNKIWGFISFRKGKSARNHYLDKVNGEHSTNILNFDGDNYAHFLLDQEPTATPTTYTFLSSPIEVVIPTGVFAKEPPKWEKTWVNHFFRSKVIDQCEYRKRRIFAYTLQPVFLMINVLARAIFLLISTSLLIKGISGKYLIHPLTYKFSDIFDIWSNGSYGVNHLPEDDREVTKWPTPWYFIKSFYRVPLMPLFWLPPLLTHLNGKDIATQVILGTWGLIFSLFLVIGFFANHAGILGIPFTWSWTKFHSLVDDTNLWYLEQEEMEFIACSKEKQPLTFDKIPAKRKTVRLKFQNLKSKVCKPFSY